MVAEAKELKLPVACEACSAHKFGICQALNMPDLIQFNQSSRRKKIKKGDILVFDQDEVTEFANIVSGTIKLSKILSDGRQQLVGLQFAPEFVGRPFNESSGLTIEAATVADVCVFPRPAFENMLKQAPDFERKLMDQVLFQLDEARDWMVTLGRKTASEKVASFLILLVNHIADKDSSADGKLRFELPITRGDMADFLGLTLETVSRQLTKLRKAGLISFDDSRNVVVEKKAALLEASGE